MSRCSPIDASGTEPTVTGRHRFEAEASIGLQEEKLTNKLPNQKKKQNKRKIWGDDFTQPLRVGHLPVYVCGAEHEWSMRRMRLGGEEEEEERGGGGGGGQTGVA